MSERRSILPNEGSEYYGQSIGLPLEETLQTVRFLSKVKPSGKYRHDLGATIYESNGVVDAWAGHRLSKVGMEKDDQKSIVEVELQDEAQGTIWLDIDERDIMIGGYPKVVIGRDGSGDDAYYYHQFGEKNAMRAAELVLRLANKRFATLGQDIVEHNAKNAEEKLRRRLAREQDALAHFKDVLKSE